MPPLLAFHLDFNFAAPRPDAVRATLAHAAARGYNAVLWEVEDKVRWDELASATHSEAMAKDEFRALLDYARDLGLAAIPLLQTLGHAEYVLLRPAFAALRELPDRHDCYCVSKPETRAFLARLVDEYLELFGDVAYFHLGGDEAYVFGQCPVCARRDRVELYAEHMDALAKPLRARGVRPCLWHDMAITHPETAGRIDRSFLLWDWNYSDGYTPPDEVFVWNGSRSYPPVAWPDGFRETFPEALDADGKVAAFYTADALARMGFDIVLCPSARSYGDSPFVPDMHAHAANIAGAALKARARGFAGLCVTSWAVRLAPWALQAPLLDLAPPLLSGRAVDPETVRREVRAAYWGGLDAERLAALTAWYRPLRLFSGVMWNGLKDGLPPPPGRLAACLSGAAGPYAAFPPDTESRMAALRDALREYLPDVPDATPFQRLFREGLVLKRDALAAMSEALHPGAPALALARLDDLQSRTEVFYRHEQQPASARRNADLLYTPMRDGRQDKA